MEINANEPTVEMLRHSTQNREYMQMLVDGAQQSLQQSLGRMLPSADIHGMREWAHHAMQRSPDFVIGDDYLRRWYVVPRNEFCSVYLHHILHSDDDRALHDHPWANTSIVLDGRYIEHTPEGQFLRWAGQTVRREAETLHRLELVPGESALTLFITGPRVREWGFQCGHGWVPWQDFVDPDDPGKQGRGCGEHA